MAVSSKSDSPDSAAEPDADHFEFFSFPSPPDMCAAADVFLGGKILPFGAPPPKRAENLGDLCWQESCAASECSRRRRRFWGGRVKAEYRRLRSVSDCHGMVPPPAARQQRPRWYLCVLGSVRVPATMDISDIRSRQRRQPAAAEADSRRGPSGDVGRATWKLLRSLSCTGLDSASAVTLPLRFAAHVQDT
ncbi:hypothetical protein OPV22_018141 [Ensete ventricosum]|uniref:Uncharacterized protein n=1 Tax=Ensete ventricosum TaxID=4639 RepID=A0AAV8QUX0_ENSVE|nr:hypothetical protein OPV22_018141 [Ensete ventricosum]